MNKCALPGEEILEKIIVGRVPHIYAFRTDTIPDYLKVGDTHQAVSDRLDQWRRYFKDLKEVELEDNEATVKGASDVFFRDYSVHKYLTAEGGCENLKSDSPLVVGKTDASGNPLHYSSEFFILRGDEEPKNRRVPIETVQAGIYDVREAYRLNQDKGYRYYDARSLAVEEFHHVSSGWWKLRPNQADVVNNFVNAVKEGKKNLLMYAVMRFGKSFTAMCCARMMNKGNCEDKSRLPNGTGAKLVVIVSGKKDVLDEWRTTVESPDNFRDDYKFLTAEDLKDKNAIAKILTSTERQNRAVVFLTLQDLIGDEIKAKHKELFGQDVDLLIVDETHFGARAKKQGRVLGRDDDIALKRIANDPDGDDGKCDGEKANETIRKHFKAKVRLHLSGTPYRILMGSEFRRKDGAVIAYYQFADIAREQAKWDQENLFFESGKRKPDGSKFKEWDNPYFGFPQMLRFAFTPDQHSLEILDKLKRSGASYNFSELFHPLSIGVDKRGRHKKFRHEEEVLELLKIIDGSSKQRGLLGFLNHPKIKNGGMCRHIVCVLPYCASCDALAALIKKYRRQFLNLGEYEILNISGAEDRKTYAQSKVVKATIRSLENPPAKKGARGRRSAPRKTLTLTVAKMLTGSTVPEWDTMLYFKDTESPQEYDQAVFRLQSQYVKTITDSSGEIVKVNMKPQTLLVDFDPNRMFKMQESRSHFFNANTELAGNNRLRQRIAEDLRISPIVSLNAENGLVQVSPSDIMDAVRQYSSERGIREEAQEICIDIAEVKQHGSLWAAITSENPIGKNKGIAERPYGVGTGPLVGLDDPPSQPKRIDGTEEPSDNNKSEEGRQLQQFQSYIMRILFFAYLTQDKVTSIDDILAVISKDENVRIACNLQLRACEIKDLGTLNPHTVHEIDYKIENMNDLSREKKYVDAPDKRAEMAICKIGKLGDSIIVTPNWICEAMVNLLPNKVFHEAIEERKCFLDLNGKTGEFATAIYKRFRKLGYDVARFSDLILTIPATCREYEFTLKVYRELGLDEKCIARKFTAYDLVPTNEGEEELKAYYKRIRSVLSQAKAFDEISLDDNVSNEEGDSCMSKIYGVVVGNPPYQDQNGSGGTNDASIYQYFCDMATHVSERYVDLIIPSRWFSAGRENLIGAYRRRMLTSRKVRNLVSYAVAKEVFGKEVEIKGGSCYYVEDAEYNGDCDYKYIANGKSVSDKIPLDTFDILVRDPKLVKIVKKVQDFALRNSEVMADKCISSDTPFGIPTNPGKSKKTPFEVSEKKTSEFSVPVHMLDNNKRKMAYARKKDIKKNAADIKFPKVYIPGAGGSGSDDLILGQPELGAAGSVCSQTYLYVKFPTRRQCVNFINYLKTRFFRMLVSAVKITQHAQTSVYRFVPMQDFNRSWTDADLYRKYDITREEQEYIKSIIREME